MTTFDTPDTPDVLQIDEEPLKAIPIEGVVRTDEMPGKLGAMRNVLLRAGSRAQKILAADHRRKRVTIIPTILLDTEVVYICVAPTEAECNLFSGILLISGAQALCRQEFTFYDELWARPCVINDTAGIVTSIAASTDDAIISIITEQWAN